MDLIREIKSVADCTILFLRFWPTYFREDGNSLCPFHEDRNPSLQVSKEIVYCHGCGIKLDAVDLFGRGAGVSAKEAVQLMAREFGIGSADTGNRSGKGKRESSKKDKNPFVQTWGKLTSTEMTEEALSYLVTRRCLDREVVTELTRKKHIGFSPSWPAVAFPVTDTTQKKLLGIQFVPLDGTDKKFQKGTEPKEGFFRFGQGDFQVVTEAVIDGLSVLSACRNRIDVESIIVYSASTWRKVALISGIPILFYDGDLAGAIATAKSLLEFGPRVRTVDWSNAPSGCKDVNDLLKAGQKEMIERMIRSSRAPANMDEAVQWVQALVERMKTLIKSDRDKEQFDGFLRYFNSKVKGEIPSKFPLTEFGNSERLVTRHGQKLKFCHTSGKWFVWSGTHWVMDASGEVNRLAKETVRSIYAEAQKEEDDERRKAIVKFALASEKKAQVSAMITLAESEEGIPISPDDLDTSPWLFNVLNGTLDLRSGKLLPHEKAHLITKIAPVNFDPNSECPTWITFLDRIMDGNQNLISFLQRAIGYSFTGDISEQCFLLLYGGGANGKSTFLDILQAMMGNYAQQTDFTTFLVKTNETVRNDLARLKGSRLISAVEAADGKALAENVIKQITGGDIIAARFLFKEYFEYRPTGKIWLATNHKPKITGSDHGIWRRIKMVPFEVTIPEKERDPHLKEKMILEASGILRWVVEGCLEWQKNGLGVPREVIDATSEYRTEMDDLRTFLDDCCLINPLAKVPFADLYETYVLWCQANREKEILSTTTLGKKLRERGFPDKKGSKGLRYRMGIRLLTEEEIERRDSGQDIDSESIADASRNLNLPPSPKPATQQVIDIRNYTEKNNDEVAGCGGFYVNAHTRTHDALLAENLPQPATCHPREKADKKTCGRCSFFREGLCYEEGRSSGFVRQSSDKCDIDKFRAKDGGEAHG